MLGRLLQAHGVSAPSGRSKHARDGGRYLRQPIPRFGSPLAIRPLLLLRLSPAKSSMKPWSSSLLHCRNPPVRICATLPLLKFYVGSAGSQQYYGASSSPTSPEFGSIPE